MSRRSASVAPPPPPRPIGGTASRTAAGVAGGLARRVANLPLAASVARTHLVRNPWQIVWVAARSLPRPALRALGSRGGSGAVGVIAAAASGDRDEARARLVDSLGRSESGRAARARLLASAAATGETGTAQAALADDLRTTGATRAYIEHATGHVDAAIAALADAGGPRAHSLTTWLEGERAVLRGDLVTALVPAPLTDVPGSATVGDGRSGHLTVLHAVTNALPEVQAGYSLRTQGIVAAQRALGIEASVATPPGFPVAQGHLGAASEVEVEGVPYRRRLPRVLPVSPLQNLERYAAELASWTRDLGVDVLHAHSKHLNAQAALVAGADVGVPVVYEARGFLEETWRSRGGDAASDFYLWSRAAETLCMGRASAVVTLSESMRDDIVARGVDGSRVHVVGNCVSADYLSAPTDRDRVREALGLADRCIVGTVTTMNDYEGLDLLLEAAGLIDDERLAVLLVGDGPARVGLERRAQQLRDLGCRTSIVLTGRVPHAEARHHQAAIDIFAVPRRATPVTLLVPPLKPVEAMALGRPVVASDLPPLRELVAPDRGLLVEPDDASALAEAITTLLYDPSVRDRMGRQARHHVAAERTWAAAAERYRSIYASLPASSPNVQEPR